MIVVDTSALMAVLLDEVGSAICMDRLENADLLLISAGTVAEALVVAGRRGILDEMSSLLDGLGFEIISVSASTARGVADAYRRFGRGVHPAGLNFGDCFAYALAAERSCPLLFVGSDFSKTDLVGAA